MYLHQYICRSMCQSFLPDTAFLLSMPFIHACIRPFIHPFIHPSIQKSNSVRGRIETCFNLFSFVVVILGVAVVILVVIVVVALISLSRFETRTSSFPSLRFNDYSHSFSPFYLSPLASLCTRLSFILFWSVLPFLLILSVHLR